MDEVIEGIEERAEANDGVSEQHRGVQQTQLSDATQPISQTAYDDVLRSRSEQASLPPHPEPHEVTENEEETDEPMQDSVQEGDPNFLDICSSYIAAPNEHDSIPVNFSPTQTQSHANLFPESQRFKTPATAGRKRDYSGNLIDTPAESRNPFARTGIATHGNVVGLSQAFENTQAASSPLPFAPTSALRSDKPSPGIEIQRRIENLGTSSPSRLLSDPRRSSEPASVYIPAGQSQSMRKLMASEPEANKASQGSTTDGFNSVSGLFARRKRAAEREMRGKREIAAASSPLLSGPGPESTQADKLPRRAESEQPRRVRSRTKSRSLPSSPPALASDETDEEETLDIREDEITVDVPTQPVPVRTERREVFSAFIGNHQDSTTLVPDTTKRTTRSATHLRHSVQPSPSEQRIRYARSTVILDPVSSNPIRVANSQRSAPSTQEIGGNLMPASPSESVDVIPASPDGQLQSTEPSDLQPKIAGEDHESEPFIVRGRPQPSDQSNHALEEAESSGPPIIGTIPETSSSVPTDNQQKESTYTTAPINQIADASTILSEWSSQPIRTTPPGRKRKRLGEISQDDKLPTATQSSAFDPAEALALDRNPEVAKALSSSQDPDPIQTRKRARLDAGMLTKHAEVHETVHDEGDNATNFDRHFRSQSATKEYDEQNTENAVPSSSLSELPSTPDVHKTPTKKLPPKSIWSPGESPQQKCTATIVKPTAQPRRAGLQEITVGRNNRRVSKTTLKTPKPLPGTLPSIEEASPNPLVDPTLLAATATPAKSSDEVIAPQMVFVYFMNKSRAYYPAICQAYISETDRYTIVWPGYDAEHMAKHSLCSLDLRAGDEVRVERKGWPRAIWRVHGFGPIEQGEQGQSLVRDIYGHSSVMLEPKNMKIGMPKGVKKHDLVPISDLYLDSNQWGRVSKRPFVYEVAEVTVKPLNQVPRPSTPQFRTSTPSTPSSRGRHSAKDLSLQPAVEDGIFSKMAFALSFTDGQSLRELTDLVSSNGGVVLQPSFRELVNEKIQLKSSFVNFSFAALLADRHTRKEKYMQALALGLPCLNGKWVKACIRHRKLIDWQDYLLPAGESEELDGAIRSRTLPSIDMGDGKLSDILENRPQFFADKHVIFTTGRGKAEVKRRTYLFFVRVMGAAKIEEVLDLAAAQLRLKEMEKQSDVWLVVDDKEYEGACAMVEAIVKDIGEKGGLSDNETNQGWKCRVADSEFVMQSLIFGRLCEGVA